MSPRLRLENGPQIRREIVRCYRDMKAGKLDPNKGSKLVWILDTLSRALEREKIEQISDRLDRIETSR